MYVHEHTHLILMCMHCTHTHTHTPERKFIGEKRDKICFMQQQIIVCLINKVNNHFFFVC